MCEERANECQPSSLCSHLIARAESLPKPAIMLTSVASAGIEARYGRVLVGGNAGSPASWQRAAAWLTFVDINELTKLLA